MDTEYETHPFLMGDGERTGDFGKVEHLQLATFHQSGVHIHIASSRQAM